MTKKLLLLSLFFLIFAMPIKVNADIGPKPSIDVIIKNLDTTNYIIDLLVYDKDGNGYKAEKNYNGEGLTEEQIDTLYNINYDGWISESTRWSEYLLMSDCQGNKDHSHYFSYFGTPTKYKVLIINNDTGEIKITNELVRLKLNSSIKVDYKTMNSVNEKSNRTIINSVIALVLTIFIEVLIAHIFKTGCYKVITITNIITNILLQGLLLILTDNFILTFIIGELIVITCELLIYLYRFRDISKLKTLLYTLCANGITILITILTFKI